MLFKTKKKDFKYSDLSSREQAKIIKKSVREANEDQLALVKEFDIRFKRLKQTN